MEHIHNIIYSKQQQDVFRWSFDTGAKWNWISSPLKGTEKLYPLKGCIKDPKEVKERKKKKIPDKFIPLINFCRKQSPQNTRELAKLDKDIWKWIHRVITEKGDKKNRPRTASLLLSFSKKFI